MLAEDLLTDSPTAEAVVAEIARLPQPSPEQEEALRHKLEHSAHAPLEREWPPMLQRLRDKLDTRFADPPTSHRPVVGPLLVLTKRAFRLTFQPLINELLRRQVEFNEELLDSLATLHDQQRLQSHTQALWRREMEERLARLEQALASKQERVPARSTSRRSGR
jgi:hypothetical protein